MIASNPEPDDGVLQSSSRIAGRVSLIGVISSAEAQTARTLKIVVPLAAGGGADIVARVRPSRRRAQNVTAVVENRPGAAP